MSKGFTPMQLPATRTLPHLLAEMAARYPDRNCLTDGARRMSYAEFHAEVKSVARSFHALGVRKGDRVAVLMGNQIEWLVAKYAVAMLGGVVVALNTWWRRDELSHALGLTEPVVLVTVGQYLNNDYTEILRQMGDLAIAAPALKHIVHVGETGPEHSKSWSDFRRLGASVSVDVVDAAMDQVDPHDDAMILFTSGSTAKSKGVPLVHRGLVENMYAIGERMHLTEQDRLLLVISLFWGFGLNAALAFISHGASIVLQHRHDAAETLSLIESERCTGLYATPNFVHTLYAHPDRMRRDLSTLRTGEARSSVVHLLHEMGAREVCTMYGLTEGYANSTVTDGRLPLEVRQRISGHPLPNTELQIVDPTTHAPLSQGEIGEVRIRGYITRGYCKNPEATAQAIDGDGWFYTGDLARLDATGGLEIKGRLKEMIKTGGISVTPADVENLLLQVPGVAQAFVVGVPDQERDEVIAAMVVLHDGSRTTVDDLIRHCRQTAATYKVPRHIELVGTEDVPLTLTGKIHKPRIQELLGAKYLAVSSTRKGDRQASA